MTAEKFSLDPNMTTSAEWHEARAEERKEMGVYFGDRVSVKSGSKPQGKSKEVEGPTLKPYPQTLNVARTGHEPVNNKPTRHKAPTLNQLNKRRRSHPS
ncbi:hypothetical protein [Synechococcus sp. CC9605]|uniref:hypothetical protein n=1 Tax=Synechococcus sp. (strain CC9605) TaxID=110662 RepID=UPI00059E0FB7|nr:hypothetical protein [Synechococcus sp. CC9605]